MNPLYGYVEGYPWYSILMKCLAKIFGSYSFENFFKIAPSKLYELFTGMESKTVRVEDLKNAD